MKKIFSGCLLFLMSSYCFAENVNCLPASMIKSLHFSQASFALVPNTWLLSEHITQGNKNWGVVYVYYDKEKTITTAEEALKVAQEYFNSLPLSETPESKQYSDGLSCLYNKNDRGSVSAYNPPVW